MSSPASTTASPPSSPRRRNEVQVTLEDGSKLVIRLTWFDKIMRFLLSTDEFEARMLEKIEKAKLAHQKRLLASS